MQSSHYREERSPNNGSLDRCGTVPIRDHKNQPFHQASHPYVEEIIGPVTGTRPTLPTFTARD